MIVLATDPSLSAFGYAVLDTKGPKILATGCIKTEPAKPVTKSDTDRLTHISKILCNLCDKYKVEEIWSETVVGSKSSKAAKALQLCKGALIGLSVGTDLPLKFCPPQAPKLSVTGNKTASKEEMVEAIQKKLNPSGPMLGDLPIYKQQAIADALAVFLYFSDHGSQINTSKT